jgi:hypothetical protein
VQTAVRVTLPPQGAGGFLIAWCLRHSRLAEAGAARQFTAGKDRANGNL